MNRGLRLLPRTLVGRVFALYTVTLIAVVAAGLGLFYRYQFAVELEEAQLRAEALSAVMVPTVSDSAVIGDYDTIGRTLERAVHHSSFSSASFIDLRGGVVRAPRDDAPDVEPPRWLRDAVAERLYDANLPINVGGRDYGVLRLSFAPDRIAGRLWEQTRIALWLGLLGVIGGLVLIRFPLVRWLGKLSHVHAFDQAMRSGEAVPAMLSPDNAPLEFRETFEVLGRAAASLQSQRARADVTLGAIADGVFTLDATGRVVFVNPAACAMAGQTAEAMFGRPAADLLPSLCAGVSQLRPWTGRRATLTAVGGAEVVLDTTLSPIRAPDGSSAGFVLACRDISEQHALDQRLRTELQARESALVALRQVLEGLTQNVPAAAAAPDDLAAISMMISELVSRLQVRGEQLDAIFALSPDGFVSFDAQRRVNYVSPAFTQLTGLTEAQAIGVYERDIEAQLHAQCDSALPWRGLEALRRDLRQRDALTAPKRELIETARPARRVLEVGLREGSTAAISQVLSLRDVTHESLVDQMKSEFLSTAAHELRTPMASIYGFTELMLRRKMPPERQTEMLETIYRQSQRMISIINELLDLARIEARRGKDFVLATFDLSVLAGEVLHDFKPPQDRRGPIFETLATPARVRADRNKMHQAIGNVLSNAYKYSPGGGEVQVRIVHDTSCAQGPEPMVGIEVRDHGIGMTPAQLARVSERFYRADSSGGIAGTGLGMSIVKEIVELLGGRLALASEPGVGSTVTVWLPVQSTGET